MSLANRLLKLENTLAEPNEYELIIKGGISSNPYEQATIATKTFCNLNDNDTQKQFVAAVWNVAKSLDARFVAFGGLPNDKTETLELAAPDIYTPRYPRKTVTLPRLHSGQIDCFNTLAPNGKRPRFLAVRCGRRWGKTIFDEVIACDGASKGENIGIFAPNYKITSEVFREIGDILQPIKKQSSQSTGVFRTSTGGRIDVWTLEDDRAGRSRKYHRVLIDEAAFTKPNMMDIWRKSIKPSLLDYAGSATVTSTPNGISEDNFFYQICNDKKEGFIEYHAPTSTNPHLPKDEIDKLESENHPLVFKQEYLAEFIDWSGDAFFSQDKFLIDGAPATPPAKCDGIFAVIDSAVKTGSKNDGTAVIYYAIDKTGPYKLYVIDWDIIQIEAALLETWLPTVFQTMEHYAALYGARMGTSIGVHIEDKASGSILLQQAARRGWNTYPIDSVLTSVGKDERAISVSSYVYRNMIKITNVAFNKAVAYKGQTRNYFLQQVCGFHIGVPDQSDDLLDCLTYGISIALGDYRGV